MNKNWKRLTIALFSTLLVLGIIITPVVLLTTIKTKPNNPNENVPLPPDIITPPSLFEHWSESELKANKFSTINKTNNKLEIVEKRGADDILDADFSDGRGNCDPLLGEIINEQYLSLAKISYSVNFAIDGANYMGTSWILDYQLTNDGTYPTVWYFATNTHVMDDLKTLNSTYYETNTQSKPEESTSNVKFKKLVNPNINETYKKSSFNNPQYVSYNIEMKQNSIPLNDPPVKPIFLGFDYLKSSPNEFIENVPQPSFIPDDVVFDKTEEMADFAVFEIDFKKIINIPSKFNNNPSLYAQEFTSNYANWAEKDKFKIAPNSLLKQYSEISTKKFYALGFPQEYAIGGSDNTRFSDEVGMFINAPKNLNNDKYKNYGSLMVKERHYNTFKNAPGIFDLAIGSADFGYKSNPISSSAVSEGIIPWIYQGLSYIDQNGDMQVGSSGSIFVDENNYIYGIHFASDFSAHVGINFALKCEGYNYHGDYGIYNLQPYDLIYGGYTNQKSSYIDQLKKIYKNQNFKTYIFNKGIMNY